MKTCQGCKVEKQFSDFFKNKTTTDGLQVYCKVCRKEICREYVRNNREKVNKWANDYRKRNLEKVLDATKKWRECNVDEVKKYQSEYIQKNLKRLGARNRLEAAELTDNYVYRLLVQSTGLERCEIPIQLIQAKRVQLKIVRKIKEMKA